MHPSITIAVTRHSESDDLVARTLQAAVSSAGVQGEVLFLDQKGAEAGRRATGGIEGRLPIRVLDGHSCGLSQARNRLLQEARNDIVLFLDADACPDPWWAAWLRNALTEPSVAIAGSRILPDWAGRPPVVARSSIVREQYSLLDLGTNLVPAAKVVGAGFGLNKKHLGDNAVFNPALGRQNGKLIGGEETELCDRAVAAGANIHYEGRAVVYHHVSAERLTWKWLVRRFFAAGESRALRKGTPAPFKKPDFNDWLLALPLLPFYVAGYTVAKKRTFRIGQRMTDKPHE